MSIKGFNLKIVFYSFIGWFVLILLIILLGFIGLANPLFTMQAMFSQYGVESVYHFQTFGIIFTVWAISATLSIMILNIISSAAVLEAIVPFLLLFIVCVLLGYKLRLKEGILSVITLFVLSTMLALGLSFFVSGSLPTSGLSPEDAALISSLGDEITKLTYLIPPNRIVDVVLTVASGLAGAVFGHILYPVVESRRKTTKKRKPRK
jgi:hypothetical protein